MRYLILGASEARDAAGRALPLGGQRLRALLAALALRAESQAPVSPDALISEVWADTEPEAMPDNAPAALQALVGRLRRVIGRDAVESLPGGYRLRTDPEADEVDLVRFQRLAAEGERALEAGDPATAAAALREGLALWRGPALADLPDRASAAARAESLRLVALQRRLAADLALGSSARVLPELRELAAERPLDEPLQALFIRALRDAGRTAEALTMYESVRKGIAARLGADPGAELRSLHAELLAGGPGPGEHTRTHNGTPAPGRASPQGTPYPSGTPYPPGTTSPSGTQPSPDTQPSPGTKPPPGTEPHSGTEQQHRKPGSPGNLRSRLTSFVGREADIATIGGDLARARLVTLTGPGGSGKTRLSEQVAVTASATSPAPYPDGTWLVELAPLDHPDAVPGAVLSALGRRETALSTAATEGARSMGADSDATALLIEHCQHRALLLVLDNCEHVIAAAATLAETLLAHCPRLTVLATSREPLGVPGETVRPVEPLSPASALRLFADRAAAARPGFRTEEDPAAVAEICRRLDGLPLAIELAAARLRSLTPHQIASRLDDRFRLLTSGSRTVLPRQQTLRAVVDWSWDLLDERERTVLRRLSVFAGGCTLSAAERVCADGNAITGGEHAVSGDGNAVTGGENAVQADGNAVSGDDVLDVLSALVDKSILVADHPQDRAGTGVRYRMLETIHEYARERASEHPADRTAAERRHTDQILRFVTAAEPRLRSSEQLSWLPRMEADLDNIRAVLHRAAQRRDLDTMVELVRAVGWFWWLRNYRDEGSRWVGAILEMLPADASVRDERQELLFREFQLLDYFLIAENRAQELFQDPGHQKTAAELVEAFRKPGPASARFPGMLWPFTGYFSEGSRGVAPLMDLSVANCRRYSGPWELAVALLFRAHVRIDAPGGVSRTAEDITEVEALSEATGDRWLLSQLCGLRAEIAIQKGNYDAARAECERAMRYARQLGALTEIPVLLVRIADIWFRQGDGEQAEKLAQRAVDDAERLGVPDAQTLAVFLRATVALENRETARARALYSESELYATVGTPPAVFAIAMRMLDARITASEADGASGGRAREQRVTEAVRKAREALRLAVDSEVAELFLTNGLLNTAFVVHKAGHHSLAVRIADAAEPLRVGPANVPEQRLDRAIRAAADEVAGASAAAGAPGTSDANDASGAPDSPPLTSEQVIEQLDALLTPADEGTPQPPSAARDL
ncbi:AfsR/SARP family transcriptional regulator [Streptomyces iconiensis]|uniref:BTAD domain-containing putative transcriptional regulator n=1 Tax=Streptomyces iconiensis TaxID=1384038 RepID=A0ABT7A7P3_9ACTN|nr:BTAD domain-containing putative transcriptional regulator [Streptomyces iconiensis]MDJ1137348.1 BTAD domain-containing putative transcriptional regulator [Streptomyces iconiensis]